MEGIVSKERKPVPVKRSFVSSRVAEEVLASAYEHVVPVIRKPLSWATDALGPAAGSRASRPPIHAAVGGDR